MIAFPKPDRPAPSPDRSDSLARAVLHLFTRWWRYACRAVGSGHCFLRRTLVFVYKIYLFIDIGYTKNVKMIKSIHIQRTHNNFITQSLDTTDILINFLHAVIFGLFALFFNKIFLKITPSKALKLILTVEVQHITDPTHPHLFFIIRIHNYANLPENVCMPAPRYILQFLAWHFGQGTHEVSGY